MGDYRESYHHITMADPKTHTNQCLINYFKKRLAKGSLFRDGAQKYSQGIFGTGTQEDRLK